MILNINLPRLITVFVAKIIANTIDNTLTITINVPLSKDRIIYKSIVTKVLLLYFRTLQSVKIKSAKIKFFLLHFSMI